MKVISFSGGIGAGKDTACQILLDYFNSTGLTAQQFSFASPLYEEVAGAFDVSLDFLTERSTKETPSKTLCLQNCKLEEFKDIAKKAVASFRSAEHLLRTAKWASFEITDDTPLSPREVLKAWGTDFRRNSEFGKENYWVDQAKALIDNSTSDVLLCSDSRFDTERAMLKELDSIFVRVNRECFPEDDEVFLATMSTSDTQWRRWEFDLTITNPYNNTVESGARYREALLTEVLLAAGLPLSATDQDPSFLVLSSRKPDIKIYSTVL